MVAPGAFLGTGSRCEFYCVNARQTHWGKDWSHISVIYSRGHFVLVIFLHPLLLKGEDTAQRSIEPNKLMACNEVRGGKEREVEEENEKWQGWVCKRKQSKHTWEGEHSVGKKTKLLFGRVDSKVTLRPYPKCWPEPLQSSIESINCWYNTSQTVGLESKTIEYPRRVTRIVLNREKCNAQYGGSNKGSQSLISKAIASLQLPLKVPVAIKTVSILRCALRTMHARLV